MRLRTIVMRGGEGRGRGEEGGGGVVESLDNSSYY
jgi:hypothetical protein